MRQQGEVMIRLWNTFHFFTTGGDAVVFNRARTGDCSALI